MLAKTDLISYRDSSKTSLNPVLQNIEEGTKWRKLNRLKTLSKTQEIKDVPGYKDYKQASRKRQLF